MRILKAFVTALVLFAITVAGFRWYVNDAITSNTNDIDYYLSRKKYLSTSALANNLNKNTALVLGSSELSRLYNSKYHPKQMVNAKDKSFMLIGEGYFQSLNHAIRVGAVANSMQNKKVNLILSPQWFTPEGAEPMAFASRFSEDNFIDFLKNSNITKKTKQQIIQRTNKLLAVSPKMADRIKTYEQVFTANDASLLDSIYASIFTSFISLKTDTAFLSDYQKSDIRKKVAKSVVKFTGIDEAQLLKDADKIGAKEVTNPFNMENKNYHKRYAYRVDRKKNSQLNDSYSKSVEYGDLQLFLDVCKENHIDVNLIMIPVNGAWYDHVGFSREKRQEYYDNIRKIAKKNKVTLSDLSSHEYTNYFFMDATHYGWKGWIYVNESILTFESK